jgi:hypothetical protein
LLSEGLDPEEPHHEAPMSSICVRVRFVSIGLSRLGKQDEGRRVGGLQTERQIEQDEGVGVERREPRDVETNPDGDQDRLGDERDARREDRASR